MKAPSLLRNNCDLRHWSHQYNQEGAFYIALGDANMAFTDTEIEVVREMWTEDRHLGEIAETLRRPEIEVVVLVLDLADKGKLKHRASGALGAA